MRGFFRFPDPVNEVAARLVAAGVVVMSVGVLLGARWLLIPLAFGFLARVSTGPRVSPLALLVTKVVVPKLHVREKLVPGPPKRFAQGIGAVLSGAALVSWAAFGNATIAGVLVGAIVVAATLESVFAMCIGCMVFVRLMRVGLIPSDVCEACSDLSDRHVVAARASSSSSSSSSS